MSIGAEINRYLEMKVLTAAPEELVGMLYEGAIRFMKQAIYGINEKDWHETNLNMIKAQNIVNELNMTLNRSRGGEIADNLSKIYDYLSEQLIKANIKKDANMINECIDLVSELNSAWSEVIKSTKSSNKAGVNLAS